MLKSLKRIVEIEVKEFSLNSNPNEVKNVSPKVSKVKTFSRVLKKEFKKSFDPSAILSEQYLMISAGNHLYECGLTFHQFLPGRDRKYYFNPFWICFVYLLIIIRSIASLICPDDYKQIYVYLGDFTYYLNAKAHINPAIILSAGVLVLTQCLHFWHYMRGVTPQYLRPFMMASGLCSPQDIGLLEENDIKFMMKTLKRGQLVAQMNIYSIMMFAILLSFVPLALEYNWYQMLFFGLPWSIVFGLCVCYMVIQYLYNSLYFLFICLYFISKLKHLNKEIEDRIKIKSRKFDEIQKLIKQMDVIYSEISTYNDMYWSKFNFLFICLISVVINLFLYQSLFGEMFWFLRIIFLYFSAFMAILMITYLKMNAIIFNEANKAYKTMNQLYLEYNKWSLSISLRLKVTNHSLSFLVLLILLIKLASFIERLGTRSVGFYFGKIVVIDDQLIYQVRSF